MYIYEDHMGGLYTSNRKLSYEEIHCEQCGNTDWLIGYAATKEEAWKLLNDETHLDGCSGWNHEYMMLFLNSNWEE